MDLTSSISKFRQLLSQPCDQSPRIEVLSHFSLDAVASADEHEEPEVPLLQIIR